MKKYKWNKNKFKKNLVITMNKTAEMIAFMLLTACTVYLMYVGPDMYNGYTWNW